ncbi:metal ABC transporter ATP-binding protein [Bartonella sp. DGB1]|uniref:metal ABC transporter ATP-binding protein n=1 Tax=Bartonella sp. DGB1 TaxID=3239807 RepID=UPI00352575DC
MHLSTSLTVTSLNVIYNNGLHALKDINFNLKGGEITALIGVNGGGKSTLFKSIMGLLKPHSGNILINNLSVKNALKKSIIAYVPQLEEIDYTFPILVKDLVMTGRYGHMNFLRTAKEHDRKIVQTSLELLNLENLGNRQIGELSGGQKKRVFLARALAQEADILLLDEPFTGVDTTSEKIIIDQLKALAKQDKIILISTHNLQHIKEFCDNVIFLRQNIIAQGKIDTIFTKENLKQTFQSEFICNQINIC